MKDLIFVATLSVLAVVLALLAGGPLRIFLGLPFILIFPGYALSAALFPRKTSLDGIERLALSLGLSIAIVPLVGLALNCMPWGIRLTPIASALLTIILILCLVAAIRRKQLPSAERFQVDTKGYFSSLTLGWREGGKWDKALTAFLVIAIVGAIATTVYVVQMLGEGEDFTEFYILGPDGKAEDYPDELVAGEDGTVILGVINREHDDMVYRTVLAIEGELAKELNFIRLEHGEEWEKAITFAPARSGTNQKVEFQLYKEGTDQPCNKVHLWVDVYESRGKMAGQRPNLQETDTVAASGI